MSEIFVYGRFRHVALLETVLGRTRGSLTLRSAHMPDMRVCSVAGQPFAMLEPDAASRAPGLLIGDLDADDVARLAFHEAIDQYVLTPASVVLAGGEIRAARVFRPPEGARQPAGPWSFADWRDNRGPLAARAGVEVMAHYGRLSPSEVGHRMVGILIRAASWLSAQARPGDPERDLARDVVVHAHHRPYSNFFAAEEMDLQYRRYDGTLSPVLNRGAQILGEAAVVLPYDPMRDAVLMVEQFRAPLYMGGDRAPWLWQPVAGLVDPGETPETAARREAMEEAGLTLSRLYPVAGVYSSPGANSDFVNLFVGLGDFSAREPGGGLDEEGEDILARIVSFADLMDGVDNGRYRDMQLVLTSLWLARHRNQLRRSRPA